MGKVVDLTEHKFKKTNAGKILEACDKIDNIILDLMYNESIPPNELLAVLCNRVGMYISLTDADRKKVVKKLAQIIYKRATKEPKV